MWSSFQKLGFVLINIGVLITFLYIIWIYPLLQSAAPIIKDNELFNLIILRLHIFTAIPPLLLGLVAFHESSRRLSLKYHRWIGTVYCVCIWISAISGVMLAAANHMGMVAKFGFGTLGVAWFFTTYQAYFTGKRKQFLLHRQWMIRSFALTLAVVSVRPMFWWPPSFIPYDQWYLMVTWLCWVPNLLVAELYLRVTKVNGALKLPKKYNVSHKQPV